MPFYSWGERTDMEWLLAIWCQWKDSLPLQRRRKEIPRQWCELYLDKKGIIRDYASINELICLSNMENLNAVFINDGMPQSERLIKINQIAILQMKVLEDTGGRNLLQ